MLLLASASPRRRELLLNAGFVFEVLSVPVAEDPLPGESPAALVHRLAALKARAAFTAAQLDPRFASLPAHDPLLVLGADTIVTVDDQILGKPASPSDARRMLRLLSGRTHQVLTAVCVLAGAPEQTVAEETATESTAVTFASLSDDEIAAYVATGEPMDKAGAYAIQGYAGRWIPRIRGCYFNVVGLPIALVTSIVEGMIARSRETVGSAPGK
jgi:septum formation protein